MQMKEKSDFALVRKPSSAVEKAPPGTKRILSGMVADTLLLTKKRPSPRIVVMDENPYPVELMGLVIKKWFKNVVLQIFQDRNEALQELPLLNPDLLIVEIVNADKLDFRPFESLANQKVAYPIVMTSGFEDQTSDYEHSKSIVNKYANKGLKITLLPKPFTAEIFLGILESNLKISRDSI
jgi:chemotaxis response regulator CheB